MKNTDYFRGKKVVIIGLARSGLACANLLYDLGADVCVTDKNDSEAVRSAQALLKSSRIKSELGRHSKEFIEGRGLAVISPGVPETSPAVIWARQAKIPVISEIEVASMLCPADIIATTGTNGKTTVTTLIGKILSQDKRMAFTCGNIGNPFCAEVAKMEPGDFVSLEVSSFQLENIRAFKPKIALILNLSRNHLDRYDSMREYFAAKKRVFLNQDEGDYLVLNYDDPAVRGLAENARPKAVYFSKEHGLNPNQSAVFAVGGILGIEPSLISGVFKEFKGVEHRLEYVADINGVRFINDSKATTVDATMWALENVAGPIVLIAGGREKGNDYGIILESLRKKVKEVVLIGEAAGRIRDAFKEAVPVSGAGSMQEAVEKSHEASRAGYSVLLSPMCKSFDMFSDYEERGRVFKEAVRNLNPET